MLGFGAVSEAAISDVPGDSVFLTSVDTTSALGLLDTIIRVYIDLTGLLTTGRIGGMMLTAAANAYPVGVTTHGFVGSILVWDPVPPPPSPPSGHWTPVVT